MVENEREHKACKNRQDNPNFVVHCIFQLGAYNRILRTARHRIHVDRSQLLSRSAIPTRWRCDGGAHGQHWFLGAKAETARTLTADTLFGEQQLKLSRGGFLPRTLGPLALPANCCRDSTAMTTSTTTSPPSDPRPRPRHLLGSCRRLALPCADGLA